MGFLEEIRATDSMPPESGPPTVPGRVGQWQFPTKERVSLRGWQLSMMAHEGSVLVLWLPLDTVQAQGKNSSVSLRRELTQSLSYVSSATNTHPRPSVAIAWLTSFQTSLVYTHEF